MKKITKSFLYSSVGLFFLTQNNLLALANNNTSSNNNPSAALGGNNATIISNNVENASLENAIQSYVTYFMTFLYLIAVLYALWGGFQILTAGGDDKKVTAGKTILIQGGIGLLVIWLSGTIVSWIIRVLAN